MREAFRSELQISIPESNLASCSKSVSQGLEEGTVGKRVAASTSQQELDRMWLWRLRKPAPFGKIRKLMLTGLTEGIMRSLDYSFWRGRKKWDLFSTEAMARFLINSLPALKRNRFPFPPHEGVDWFKQANFDLDDKCVKLRFPAGIGQKKKDPMDPSADVIFLIYRWPPPPP